MDEKTTNAPIEQKTEGTPEVVLNELKAELERLKEENSKLKNAQSNASADASKYKKQLQERMTSQIADAIMQDLGAKGVMVVIEAEHMCMTMRGVKKPGSKTETYVRRGTFADDENLTARVLSMIRG